MKWTKIQLAYLAGLIDGEGCIGIAKSSKQFRHDARLTIGMTDGEYLTALADELGIGYLYSQKRAQRPGWKRRTCLSFGATACRILLPCVLPYLRLKRRQAELLLEYLELAAHKYTKPGRANKIYRAKVTAVYKALRALNKKGV